MSTEGSLAPIQSMIAFITETHHRWWYSALLVFSCTASIAVMLSFNLFLLEMIWVSKYKKIHLFSLLKLFFLYPFWNSSEIIFKGVNFVTTCVLCDLFSGQVWDSLQKQYLLGRGKAGEGCLCFVLCGGGKVDSLALNCQQNCLFSSPPQDRLTLILALHCVPDAAGQKAVEPLYTEVYVKNWGMQHVCGLSRTHAFLLEGWTYSLLTADSRKLG